MGREPFTIKRLNIAHEKSLALHLGCNVDDLQQLAESAKSFYKPFESVPKLRPFAKKPSFTGIDVAITLGECSPRVTIKPEYARHLQGRTVVVKVDCHGESTVTSEE